MFLILLKNTLTQSTFHLVSIKADGAKGSTKSRAQMKKDRKSMKTKERDTDTSSVRGFSTDQRINILSMNINKNRLEHEKNETLLVGLSIQEAALGRQLESAEARAQSRCAKYKSTNPYWSIVDELVLKHDELVNTISERTASLFKTGSNNEVEEQVNDFLNQKSPIKKRKYNELVNENEKVKLFDIVESVDTNEIEAVTYEAKEEKLNKTTSNVSTAKKRSTRNKKHRKL